MDFKAELWDIYYKVNAAHFFAFSMPESKTVYMGSGMKHLEGFDFFLPAIKWLNELSEI